MKPDPDGDKKQLGIRLNILDITLNQLESTVRLLHLAHEDLPALSVERYQLRQITRKFLHFLRAFDEEPDEAPPSSDFPRVSQGPETAGR